MTPGRDRILICTGASLRATAAGMSGILLGIDLGRRGFDAAHIGGLVTLGLAGAAASVWVVPRVAARLGRRSTLVLLGVLMACGGLVFATGSSWSVLIAAAFFGAVNGMGRDRGAGLTLDQAMLPATTSDRGRTGAFAWYNVATDGGHALGALLGALPSWLRSHSDTTLPESFRTAWFVYAALAAVAGFVALGLSRRVESRTGSIRTRLSARTRQIVGRFAALSALDSLGGGFLTSALLAYWFFHRFGVNEALLGPLFAVARIANGFSHLGAAWLARRIGLVNTMVWTHIPSSLLLATVPIAPNLHIAIGLFLLREALVEMDVPTRQSYLMAVVGESERLPAAAITNLVRATCWAVSPVVAGAAMRGLALGAPLVMGSALKIVYDLLLYRAFRHVRPPEEEET